MKKILLVTLLLIFGTIGSANAISVGTFGDIDLWVTDASRNTGTGGEYAGVDPLAALVGDDLTDGAINLGLFGTDSFNLGFSYGIVNNPGDDFVIFDGRFSHDGVSLTVDSGGGTIAIGAGAFIDSGLDFILKNTSLNFSLYGAALDLSDWGYGLGETVYDMTLWSYSGNEADIMGVGVFGAAPVPEPATMLLLGTGFIGLTVLRRKKYFKK